MKKKNYKFDQSMFLLDQVREQDIGIHVSFGSKLTFLDQFDLVEYELNSFGFVDYRFRSLTL